MVESVRRLEIMNINLIEMLKKKNLANDEAAEQALVKIIKMQIDKIKSEYEIEQSGFPYKLPLIKCKVNFNGFGITRKSRVESNFKDEVANPGEILQF